jgi:ABC-type transport system involved in cytochrome c biogenesis permease subunit
LVAVLNSNFWLATHVTTITTGYGATVICSLIGHLYLIKAVFKPNDKAQLKTIYNNMLAMTFIALFFTMFGTILGGIWGDQSWGRFWGWDPKENGALLIVMWLLMMIHLKISGLAKGEGYALGLVLANITVALAWFGVNLLSVGLHSYGFTEGVALNLFVFILAEVLIGFSLYGMIKYKKYY